MTTRSDNINEQRRQKLERLHTRGINPYPNRYHRSHTTTQAVALLQQLEQDYFRRLESAATIVVPKSIIAQATEMAIKQYRK